MNELYKELAEMANPGCLKFYNDDWEFNCAAWTGEEIERLMDIVLGRCIAVALEESISTKPVKNAQIKLEVVQAIKDYFGVGEEEDEHESQAA